MKKGAGVILYSYNKNGGLCILLGQRAYDPGKGSWGIPGGGMEASDGDDYQNTAIRECFEETGIAIKRPLIEFDDIEFPHLQWKTFIKEVPFDDRRLFREEMQQSGWFEIDNLPAPLVSHLDEEFENLKKMLCD